jgi:hypothetical protein
MYFVDVYTNFYMLIVTYYHVFFSSKLILYEQQKYLDN